MLRHDFRPGRLVTGATGLTVAALYAGDAAGFWHTPWYTVLPLLAAGLFLAVTAAWAHRRVRRRRTAGAVPRTATGAARTGDGRDGKPPR